MDAVFINLLNRSIAASWLILAVILLRVLLKKAPKWIRCILWGIVAVRLVCPFSFESILSLIPSAETINPDIVRYSPKPAIGSGVPIMNHSMNPIISGSFAPAAGASANPLYIWMHIAGIIWLIGLSCLLCYALISFLRLRRKVSEAVLLRDNIWVADMVKSPFILGVIFPKIYLSSSTEESRIDPILAHEQAHIKRKDQWWKLLGHMLLAVYWFNPLSWAAYHLFCRDIELACDEKVICELDEAGKKLYSDALLSCSMQRRVVMACPLAFGEIAVKDRIKSVLKYKKTSFAFLLVSIVICVGVAVCFLTNPVGKKEGYVDIQTDGASGQTYNSLDDGLLFVTMTDEKLTGCKIYEIFDVNNIFIFTPGSIVTSEDLVTGDAVYDYAAELIDSYESFGLRYDESTKEMRFHGKLVRYFFDGADVDNGTAVVFDFLNEDGVVDVHTVREATQNEDGSINPTGRLIGIEEYSQEEFDRRDLRALTRNQEAVVYGYMYGYADGTGGSTFGGIFAKYKDYGITYVEAAGLSGAGNVYYNGQLVNSFSDVTPTGGAFSFRSGKEEGINVRTVYSRDGKIAGMEIVQ